MKLPLTIYLIWAFINGSVASLMDIIGIAETTATVGTMETLSNLAHIECQQFAIGAKVNPIKAPSIEKVSFQLATPCGRKVFAVNETGNLPIELEFDDGKNTTVLIFGWRSDPYSDYVNDTVKAYNCRGDNNVVVVDTGGVLMNDYPISAYHTNKLGEFVAIGLKNLGIDTELIHLIGHSLGSHICGSAGRYFYTLTGEKLPHITGLDPARPCFKTPLVFPRLGVTNADFVDVIHTNPKVFGMEEAIGNADFYPQGLDDFKPGCVELGCSHLIVVQYYLQTIYLGNENSFMAARCSGYSALQAKACYGPKAPMGYPTNSSVSGIYYLTVRAVSPYGMNSTVPASYLSGNCGKCAE